MFVCVCLLCGTVFFISSRSTLSILLVSTVLRVWLSCWLSCSWSCCWWFWLSARTRSSLRSEVMKGQGSQEYHVKGSSSSPTCVLLQKLHTIHTYNYVDTTLFEALGDLVYSLLKLVLTGKSFMSDEMLTEETTKTMSKKRLKDTLLFLVVGKDVLYLGHNSALHSFNLSSQFSQLPLLAAQQHQQLILYFCIYLWNGNNNWKRRQSGPRESAAETNELHSNDFFDFNADISRQ